MKTGKERWKSHQEVKSGNPKGLAQLSRPETYGFALLSFQVRNSQLLPTPLAIQTIGSDFKWGPPLVDGEFMVPQD